MSKDKQTPVAWMSEQGDEASYVSHAFKVRQPDWARFYTIPLYRSAPEVDRIMEVVKQTDVLPAMNAAMTFGPDTYPIVFRDPDFLPALTKIVAKAVELARAECGASVSRLLSGPSGSGEEKPVK